jgi:hypothetical protein
MILGMIEIVQERIWVMYVKYRIIEVKEDYLEEALDVVKDMIDKSNPDVPEYGTKITTLILGILNVDCRVEHTITQIDGDKITPIINPNDGTGDNDKLQITIPDWIKEKQTPPFSPHTPYPEQIWYNQEPEPIQTNVKEERRYATDVSCTGNQNCITTTRNPNDCVYTGDFRDGQTSFNDK